MWPFKKDWSVPGFKREPDGRISFKLTEDEEAEVRNFFAAVRNPEESDGDWYIHPEAKRAMTAWALIGYSRSQVSLAEIGAPNANRYEFLQKALAAATKAYSLHPLPIYMFDMGSLFEMLGDRASARDAFENFLDAHCRFNPSDLDSMILKNRDVDAAVREARKSVGV
jgi:hypothetical protein